MDSKLDENKSLKTALLNERTRAEKLEKKVQQLEKKFKKIELKLLMAQQVMGIECERCGWAMKFPNRPCRCELEAELREIKMGRESE